MILFIDNYDSFVHNLARYFQRLGQDVHVVRNDQISLVEIESLAPEAIVISPGPCGPADAGISIELVRRFAGLIPMLGVCLGHQVIATAFGGEIVRASTPMHGRTSEIEHDGLGVFEDVPSPLQVCRYHSLVVDKATLPDCLSVTAQASDKTVKVDTEVVSAVAGTATIMAIRHKTLPICGVQFHPEAILTEYGYQMLANFLRVNSIACRDVVPDRTSELVKPASPAANQFPLRTIWNAAAHGSEETP